MNLNLKNNNYYENKNNMLNQDFKSKSSGQNFDDYFNPRFEFQDLSVKWSSLLNKFNKNKNMLIQKASSSTKFTDITQNSSISQTLTANINGNTATSIINNSVHLSEHSNTSNSSLKIDSNTSTATKLFRSRIKPVIIVNRPIHKPQLSFLNNNKNNKQSDFSNQKDNYLINSGSASYHLNHEKHHNILNPTQKAFLLVTLTSTTNTLSSPSTYPTTPSNDHLTYRNNEIYSIFVSMLTAAIFLFFIMWRWFRLKSDLRKALREQIEIQQQNQQTNNNNDNNNISRSVRHSALHNQSSLTSYSSSSSTSSNSSPPYQSNNRWPPNHYQTYLFLYSNTREELQSTAASIIHQLSSDEPRTQAQQKQMIDTAKYCLQQLRIHARLTRQQMQNNHSLSSNREHDNLINYYRCNSRYDRSRRNYPNSNHTQSAAVELSCSRDRNSYIDLNSSPYTLIDNNNSNNNNNNTNSSGYNLSNNSNTLNSSATVYGSICNYQQQSLTGNLNELPPPYESVIIKSSSLPSYRNLTDFEK